MTCMDGRFFAGSNLPSYGKNPLRKARQERKQAHFRERQRVMGMLNPV